VTGWITIDKLKGDSAVRDIQNLPDSGHLYAAHVINGFVEATRDGNTIVVTDVGQQPDVGGRSTTSTSIRAR